MAEEAAAVERERPSEDELIQMIRAGDEQAFRTCCERYRERLLDRIGRELPAVVKGKVSSLDVLQDAWIVAWRRIGELEPLGAGALQAWLERVVDFKVREVVRQYVDTSKREVHRERVPDGSGTGLSRVRRGPTPSQLAVAEELREAAARAFAELPAGYREVIALVKEDGLTMARAAERLGSSREAVKKLYGRAMARFTKLLERHGGRAP